MDVGDSSFLRVLITVHQLTDLRIAGPRPALRKLFALVGVDQLLDVHTSVESALARPVTSSG